MNNRIAKILTIFLMIIVFTKNINADELKSSNSHQLNFFSGVFDINNEIDINSELFGVQHSNEDLLEIPF